MYRWHSERALMLRRWREELRKHGAPDTLPPVACEDDCHCFRGMGFVRKQAPGDCGRAHCGLCHGDKHFPGVRRTRERRAALRFEELANG